MNDLRGMLLIMAGLLIVSGLLVGAAAFLWPFIGKWRWPGDLVIQRGNVTCFFPLATMILLSVGLTLLLNVLIRLFRR